MIRIVIENVLLFLLPTLVYLAYAILTREDPAPDSGGNTGSVARRAFDDAPLLYLFGAGALLVVVVLVFFGSNSGSSPDRAYVPPQMKNGTIQPGHFD